MKINHKILDCEVKEILPGVFGVIVDNPYDRAMLFCRYQEYYDSMFDEIRGCFFTMEEFMKIYTNYTEKGVFTYPTDWKGYGVPSTTLKRAQICFKNNTTKYDEIMNEIVSYCDEVSKHNDEDNPWYLIGVDKPQPNTITHEMANGLYYVNLRYKVEMDYLISQMDEDDYRKLGKTLAIYGYANNKKIIDDEIQSFMATGKFEKWDDVLYEKYRSKFVKVFEKHNKTVPQQIPVS